KALLPGGGEATGSCFTAVNRASGQLEDQACSGDASLARLYVPAHALLSIHQVSGPSGVGLALKGLLDDPAADQVYPVTLQMREPAGLAIHQQDEAGNPILGGCYSLEDDDGASAGGACDSSDDEGTDGVVHITGLTPGSYHVIETDAPEGYQLNDSTTSVS